MQSEIVSAERDIRSDPDQLVLQKSWYVVFVRSERRVSRFVAGQPVRGTGRSVVAVVLPMPCELVEVKVGVGSVELLVGVFAAVGF